MKETVYFAFGNPIVKFMVATVYQHIVEEALGAIGDAEITDCAIGEKTVAVESSLGTGIAMRYADRCESRSHLAGIERSVCKMHLHELVSAYLETDKLYQAISLAAINSILNVNGTVPAPDYQDFVADMPKGACLGLVGYFAPVVRMARLCGVSLRIFELKGIPQTLRPAAAAEQMPLCDGVILTGSAFSNKSIHHYLPHIPKHVPACILGPSTPLAGTLGRFSLGSSRVCHKACVFDAVRRHASCGHLRRWLEKIGRPPVTDGDA